MHLAIPTRTPSRPSLQQQALRQCPCCGAAPAAWLPIRYGVVAPSVVAQARRGELVLGSLNHGKNEPRWACTRCETRFGRPRPELDRFGRPMPGPGPEPVGPIAARVLDATVEAAAERAMRPVVEVAEPARLDEVWRRAA